MKEVVLKLSEEQEVLLQSVIEREARRVRAEEIYHPSYDAGLLEEILDQLKRKKEPDDD